jgi:hypothetical protein
MQDYAHHRLQLSQERIERDIAHAADSRRAARSNSSIRRSVGHRIIRFGERLAAESSLELVRSR